MFGFITYIESDGGIIGGYLVTNRELSPLQFGHTSKISLPSKLEKILHGVQLNAKWYGDLIGGTLFDGLKSIDAGDPSAIAAIFVSHAELLHVRNKTNEIPVVYVNERGEIITHRDHERDAELTAAILADINKLSSLEEIYSRIIDGITECIAAR
jgi:hypothetical protein